MGSMSKRASGWLVPTALGSAALTAAIVGTIRPASAFGRDGLQQIHERITRNAFPFMTGGVLDTIVAGYLDEDEGAEADLAERHAQNGRFRDSAAYVNMRYGRWSTLCASRRRKIQTGPPACSATSWTASRTSIRTRTGSPRRLRGWRSAAVSSSGLGLWTLPAPYSTLFDDVVVIEGDPPEGVSVLLPADANGRVSSALPTVDDRRIFAAPVAGRVVDRAVAGPPVAIADGQASMRYLIFVSRSHLMNLITKGLELESELEPRLPRDSS
jgi:hypothetical protein